MNRITFASDRLVVVSFARNRRPQAKSFPRKRESRPQAIRNAPPTDWIPASAGMTGASKAMRFQMTRLPVSSNRTRPSTVFPCRLKSKHWHGDVAPEAAAGRHDDFFESRVPARGARPDVCDDDGRHFGREVRDLRKRQGLRAGLVHARKHHAEVLLGRAHDSALQPAVA